MKKIVLGLLMSVSFYSNAQVPSYVPTSGLVGYWPFNGNANDESGNGNNGTVNGATLTTDRNGNTNNAYSFDGDDDNIVVNNSSSLNPTQLTITVWYLATGNDMCVISKNYPSNALKFSYNIKHQDVFQSNLGLNVGWGTGNCTSANEFWGSNGQIPTNQWVNITFTLDASGVGKVYYNSNLISTYNGAILQSCNDPLSILKFGGPHWNNDLEWFNGKIDDIGIWNRALTQQEITNLYNASQCITNITVTDTLVINIGQLSFNDPVAWANNITIAPNPANSQININFNNITNLNGGTLKVINSSGQQVASTPITLSGTNTTLALTTWGGAGLYFVQIINAQGQIVDIKKIILQ